MEPLNLEKVHLAHGSHSDRSNGLCAMEVVAWMAGEPHSDSPECACPVLSSFMRSWNDGLPDKERDILKPFLPRLIGTRSTSEVEQVRGFMAGDWLVRVQTPAWLDLKPELAAHAAALRALASITDAVSLAAAVPVIEAARSAAAAAWDAARAAAAAAAWDAAWAAAWDAAWDAARAAAAAAAWDAAWAAAWDAAWDAARAALEATKKKLQQSALELLDRMIEVKPTES